jgi:hypothetical protein
MVRIAVVDPAQIWGLDVNERLLFREFTERCPSRATR